MRAWWCRPKWCASRRPGPNSAIDFGIDARCVRLHVGLEGADALWSDLAGAIDFAARAQT